MSADDTEFRRKVVESYVEGLAWVLSYYYQGQYSFLLMIYKIDFFLQAFKIGHGIIPFIMPHLHLILLIYHQLILNGIARHVPVSHLSNLCASFQPPRVNFYPRHGTRQRNEHFAVFSAVHHCFDSMYSVAGQYL